jgi:hypothetical protein
VKKGQQYKGSEWECKKRSRECNEDGNGWKQVKHETQTQVNLVWKMRIGINTLWSSSKKLTNPSQLL